MVADGPKTTRTDIFLTPRVVLLDITVSLCSADVGIVILTDLVIGRFVSACDDALRDFCPLHRCVHIVGRSQVTSKTVRASACDFTLHRVCVNVLFRVGFFFDRLDDDVVVLSEIPSRKTRHIHIEYALEHAVCRTEQGERVDAHLFTEHHQSCSCCGLCITFVIHPTQFCVCYRDFHRSRCHRIKEDAPFSCV